MAESALQPLWGILAPPDLKLAHGLPRLVPDPERAARPEHGAAVALELLAPHAAGRADRLNHEGGVLLEEREPVLEEVLVADLVVVPEGDEHVVGPVEARRVERLVHLVELVHVGVGLLPHDELPARRVERLLLQLPQQESQGLRAPPERDDDHEEVGAAVGHALLDDVPRGP